MEAVMKSPIIWAAALVLGCAALQAAAADRLLTRSQALAQASSADVKQRRTPSIGSARSA